MEIQTLVYIGVLLIIISISLNVYLSWNKIKQLLNHKKDSKNFEDTVKTDLNKITIAIEDDLKNNSKEEGKADGKADGKVDGKADGKLYSKEESKADSKVETDVDEKPDPKKDPKTLEIDKEIEKLNLDLKKLENEIAKEETNLLATSSESATSKNENNKKEVYLVKSNMFGKNVANTVCKALFNGEIATKSQIEEAGNHGANWCNYGWANDNNAYYPLNQDIDNSTCTGKKGLNGGVIPNSDNYKLGINCFGVKPDESKYGSLEQIYNMDMFNELERETLDKYKKKLNDGDIKLEAYNPNQWSKYSYKKDSININNNMVITTTKTDKSKDPSSIKIEKNKIDAIIKTK